MNSSTAPSFVPTTDELSHLERDLRFHPSTTTNPTTLSPEQIAAFNRDGYLAGIRIFSEDEIADIRAYFDELLARTLAAGGDRPSPATLAAGPGVAVGAIGARKRWNASPHKMPSGNPIQPPTIEKIASTTSGTAITGGDSCT